MNSDILSNVELYYAPEENISADRIVIDGDEFKHAVLVMRNVVGGVIYVTNGIGSIFKNEIVSIEKHILKAKILEEIKRENELYNITFCIPRLKNPDRLKFAIEKSVELGITNFILFDSERTVSKSSNINRLEKIALAAMKQSLRAFVPKIKILDSLKSISLLTGEKILLEQNAKWEFVFTNNNKEGYFFIFGPEGGLTENELNLFDEARKFSLGDHRLRSETAIIKCASLL